MVTVCNYYLAGIHFLIFLLLCLTWQIVLVGMVCNKASRATDATFTLDDGTGRMDFIRWSTFLALSFPLVVPAKS